MPTYKVAEIFTSINGEGPRSGQLALFIRLAGCNLSCSYCDTRWANEAENVFTLMDTEEILEEVRLSGVKNVTLTGGEPLFREYSDKLVEAIGALPGVRLEIETNGSVDLASYTDRPGNVYFTMDYKLPGSGMEKYMRRENFSFLGQDDTVKFVVSDRIDLDRAGELINEYGLTGHCRVYLSPVFGRLEPGDIVDYMKEHCLNDVTLQLQIHKIIWEPETQGV